MIVGSSLKAGWISAISMLLLAGCNSSSDDEGSDNANGGSQSAAPSVSISSDRSQVQSGETVTLSWSVSNATSCEATGGWTGSRSMSGSAQVGPIDQSTTFGLSCTGAGGSDSRSVMVSVAAAAGPVVMLNANPSTVESGQASTLSWSTQGADSCTASGDWSGDRPLTGNEATGPLSATSDYTLSCSGSGGDASQTVTVTVATAGAAPTLEFSASPPTVAPNGSSDLTWSTTNADSCTASGDWNGDRPVNGSESTGSLVTNSSYALRCDGVGGSIERTVVVNVGGGVPSGSVTTLTLTDSSSGSGRVVTLGVPLGEGWLGSLEGLVVEDSSGTVLSSQWNALSSWRTDGSVLHGALTFQVDGAGDAGGIYTVKKGTPLGGTSISKADVVSSGFDAEVEIETGGSTYSLSASDLLSGQVSARQDYTHFSGPLASEFVVGGPLRVNGSGAAHATLQGYFHVRAFSRPVERAYVTVVLENTGVFSSISDTSGDVTIRVGGSVVYTNDGFSVGADKRYPKRFWWNGDPGLWASPDVERVQDTGLVPEYREISVQASTLNGFPSSIDWHGRGQLNAELNAGGAAPYLAPLDRWSAAYLITGDRRAFDSMRAHGDAYHWLVSKFDYAMNPRDESTGFALDLADNPTVIGNGWGGPNAMSARRRSTSPMQTDMAHQPSCNYVLYLVTADYGALEHCQMWGVANWTMERPGSYSGWPRSFFRGEVRAIGWGFRNVVHAAVATPDIHPLKDTLDDAVVYAIDSFAVDARALDPTQSTGLWLTPSLAQAIIYHSDQTPNPNDSGDSTGVALWQDDYVTWAIGSAYERGYRGELDTTGVWAWKAQSVIERLGDGSRYCWANSAAYAMGVTDSAGAATYPDWATIYAKNYPSAGPCPALGSTDAGTDRTATDYGAQLGGAIATAASTGLTDALDAWQRYDQRDINWGSDSFSNAPEWAIRPRR